MKKEFGSLAKHSAVYAVAEILKKGVGFFMIPVYTAFLMPSDYGLLEIIDLTINLAGMFIGLRLGSALIRYHHEYDTIEEKQEVYTTALITTTFISLFLWVLVYPLSE